MTKHKAIPEGHMTVGEVADKMGVTVRTLQYYDREGLLPPSAESEGGRRLYTDKDVVKLHQILSMKYLGFSLGNIKDRLISLDDPVDVASALTDQAAAIREKIENLSESLKAIEALQAEVLQMQTVDFRKYADIIVNLQMKNEFYWMIKHLDDNTLNYFRHRFNMESGLKMVDTVSRLFDEAMQYQKEGIRPDSETGQIFAREFWEMLMEFTGGDMRMLPSLMKAESFSSHDDEWEQKLAVGIVFIESALDIYLTDQGCNPLEVGVMGEGV